MKEDYTITMYAASKPIPSIKAYVVTSLAAAQDYVRLFKTAQSGYTFDKMASTGEYNSRQYPFATWVITATSLKNEYGDVHP